MVELVTARVCLLANETTKAWAKITKVGASEKKYWRSGLPEWGGRHSEDVELNVSF